MIDGFAWIFLNDFNHFASQISSAFAAFGKALVFGIMRILCRTPARNHLQFVFGIKMEAIQRHNNGLTELLEVIYMSFQVQQSLFQGLFVWQLDFLFWAATVKLQTLGCGYQNSCGGCNSGSSALDIQEFLSTQVGSKTRFGDSVFAILQCSPCCHDAVTTVCDIRERSAVNKSRTTF